jgi:putative flippase GtrA
MKQENSRWFRNRQVLLYFAFGSMTTVCSLLACYLTLKFGTKLWHDEAGNPTAFLDVLGSTSQWIVALLMAFFTNKKWVFTKAEHGAREGMKQFLVFVGSRVVTYVLEVFLNLGLIALFEAAHYQDASVPLLGREVALSARLWAKLISSSAIVVINYFVSKVLVFRYREGRKEEVVGK